MRILLVADGRSPTTRRWVKMVLSLGHEVTLVSTFPSPPVEGVAAEVCLPVAFSGLSGQVTSSSGEALARTQSPSAARQLVGTFRSGFLSARYLLGPLTLHYYGPRLRRMGQASYRIVAEEVNLERMVEVFADVVKAVTGKN